MIRISLIDESFAPYQALNDFQSTLTSFSSIGAEANFIGYMRDFNEGDDVASMFLEHYPTMTERQLKELVNEATLRWPIHHVLLVHRVGQINPTDPIVLVGTWSSHRKAAFESCRFLMEQLKSRVPFWKKEILIDGQERWVEKNTKG